jgi:hypothetical protein
MQARMKVDADIFLCHSSVDKEFERRLARDLHEFKVIAWFDEWELQPGDSLVDRIGDALETSVYVGVILSPASVQSRWCKKELNQALAREIRLGVKTIVPMRVSDVDLPPFLQEKFYLDFSAGYYYCVINKQFRVELFCGQKLRARPAGETLRGLYGRSGASRGACRSSNTTEAVLCGIAAAGRTQKRGADGGTSGAGQRAADASVAAPRGG